MEGVIHMEGAPVVLRIMIGVFVCWPLLLLSSLPSAAPCGRPHRKLKLESTDVILSSSHAKKLASFLPEFRL